MTRVMYHLLVACFLTCLYSPLAQGLSCAKCTHLDPACRSGNILPTPCDVTEGYCYVLHLYVGHSQGTFRGCANSESMEGCRPARVRHQPGTSCTTLCDWEGCNSSYGNVLSALNRNR